jgi:5'-deoxynucleotidase YfbR-like HD superfamily hydrolase
MVLMTRLRGDPAIDGEASAVRVVLADRREHNLRRWHSRLTVQPRESLMCHAGSTARIALTICLALRYYRIVEPDIEAVLAGALAHDVSEVVTGDLPGGILKTKHPAFVAALQEIEREAEAEIFGGLPQPMAAYMRSAAARMEDGSLEAQIIGYADKLDAFNFARAEVALGNTMLGGPGDPPATTRAALDKMRWPWLLKLRAAAGIP